MNLAPNNCKHLQQGVSATRLRLPGVFDKVNVPLTDPSTVSSSYTKSQITTCPDFSALASLLHELLANVSSIQLVRSHALTNNALLTEAHTAEVVITQGA